MGSWKIAVTVATVAILLSGCAWWQKDEREMSRLELPEKPKSASIPCEPLSEDEEIKCLGESAEARDVCRKVEHNRLICADQQKFVERLYATRNGK